MGSLPITTKVSNNTTSTIGIIGGGKIGLQLLTLFNLSQLTRVQYVVDKDTQAPAIVEAHKEQIATFADINQALRTYSTDFIFEVTGSGKVVEIIRQALDGSASELITHEMAFILLKVIEENQQRTNAMVLSDILKIKKDISENLDTMKRALENIQQTTADLRYLALNARIEAARAGEQGRGFDVVAQEVERTASSVRQMTQEIGQVNSNISAISNQIDISLKKLG